MLRHAFTKLREANAVCWYQTVVQCLQEQYSSLKSDTSVSGNAGDIDYTSSEWADLKVLYTYTLSVCEINTCAALKNKRDYSMPFHFTLAKIFMAWLLKLILKVSHLLKTKTKNSSNYI